MSKVHLFRTALLSGLIAAAGWSAAPTDADARGGGGVRASGATSVRSSGGGRAANRGGGGMQANRGGGGAQASRGSMQGSNRGGAQANRTGNRAEVGNRVNTGAQTTTARSGNRTYAGNRTNTGNVNIGSNNNVNIDVDNDHGWGWDDDYHPVARGVAFGTAVAVTSAVVGSMIYSLPPSCVNRVYYGVTYYGCGNVWYQPQYQGDQVVYVVVDQPG